MKEQAIGILDSGVGGLTVAREVMRQLPRETIYYVGDTKRCPYGPRSMEEVQTFTMEIVQFLMGFPLKAILIACNTATAAALDLVREQINVPVLGVIEPGARAAIKATRNHTIGVIGTQGTIRSKAYERALRQIHPGLAIHSLACPTLVPLVESGLSHTAMADKVVGEALAPLKKTSIDTLILGCTHYPLLTDSIRKTMKISVSIISSAEETAAELSTILQHQQLLSQQRFPQHRFFTTGSTETFTKVAEELFGNPVIVEQIDLGSLTVG
ncbi:glutamate racemase [Thermoactinomyces sp. AMNI-1]|uniref:Glutamate racemase n=2 Tax=Thermoactinomyces mirandus TaxID=2756294 RepID=A0A7W2AR60_9BACL|nr:glutamate racemase [Thermoactinomyces mirandus]